MDDRAKPAKRKVALVLGGGNALGAYHLGVCERLLAAGLEPSWMIGTSIGAVTAAILAGNRREERLGRLHEFWRQASPPLDPFPTPFGGDARADYNTGRSLGALLFGRPGLFAPRYPGVWSLVPGFPKDVALRDHGPLAGTLERLIDFDRLNGGKTPLSIVALDVETGEEVWFEAGRDEIGPRHLLACTALLPLFPPVEIEGRLLCDAGFANNVPVDRVFRHPPRTDLLCIVVDPFNAHHDRPRGARRGGGTCHRHGLHQPDAPLAPLSRAGNAAPTPAQSLKPLGHDRASRLPRSTPPAGAEAAGFLGRLRRRADRAGAGGHGGDAATAGREPAERPVRADHGAGMIGRALWASGTRAAPPVARGAEADA